MRLLNFMIFCTYMKVNKEKLISQVKKLVTYLQKLTDFSVIWSNCLKISLSDEYCAYVSLN